MNQAHHLQWIVSDHMHDLTCGGGHYTWLKFIMLKDTAFDNNINDDNNYYKTKQISRYTLDEQLHKPHKRGNYYEENNVSQVTITVAIMGYLGKRGVCV